MNFDPRNPFCEENVLEAMPTLFQVERRYMGADGYSKKSNILSPRGEAMQMIKHYARSSFLESVIPFLAVNYFDRFIARKPVPIEQGLKFKMEQILEMELLILGELKWCMRSVTAFCFLDFFNGFFELNDQYKEDLKHHATENIYKNQYEIRYTEFKPSIIAASALLFSVAFQLRANLSDFKQAIDAICSCKYVEAESLYRCMPKSIGEEWLKHILISRSVSQANVAAGGAHGSTTDAAKSVSPPLLFPLETSATDPTTELKTVIDSIEEPEHPTDESRFIIQESSKVGNTPRKRAMAEEIQRDMES